MNIAVKPRSAASLANIELREASLQSGLERRRLQSYLAIMLGDIAMLLLGFVAGGYLYFGHDGVAQGLLLGQLVLPAFLTIALYNSSYSLDTLRRPFHGIARALMALLLSSAVVIFIAFYTKSSRDFSRVTFTSGVLFASMLIPWLRAQMRVFVYWRCGNFVINELVIDDGGPMIDLPHVRRIDAARFSLVPDSSDPVALDRIGSLLRNVDRVIISCPPDRRKAWAMICKGAAIEGEVIDDTIADLDALGARLAGGRGLLLVSVGPLGLRMRDLPLTPERLAQAIR